MAYAVDAAMVADQVAKLDGHVLEAWRSCLEEIAKNPHPRFGVFVDRAIPIRGFPLRSWVYEIAQEMSISGEDVFIFYGDFFPEYAPTYLIYEERQEVVLIHLRDNHRS